MSEKIFPYNLIVKFVVVYTTIVTLVGYFSFC